MKQFICPFPTSRNQNTVKLGYSYSDYNELKLRNNNVLKYLDVLSR